MKPVLDAVNLMLLSRMITRCNKMGIILAREESGLRILF